MVALSTGSPQGYVEAAQRGSTLSGRLVVALGDRPPDTSRGRCAALAYAESAGQPGGPQGIVRALWRLAVEVPPLAPGGQGALSEEAHDPEDVLLEVMLQILGMQGRSAWSELERRRLASFRAWVAGWLFTVARPVEFFAAHHQLLRARRREPPPAEAALRTPSPSPSEAQCTIFIRAPHPLTEQQVGAHLAQWGYLTKVRVLTQPQHRGGREYRAVASFRWPGHARRLVREHRIDPPAGGRGSWRVYYSRREAGRIGRGLPRSDEPSEGAARRMPPAPQGGPGDGIPRHLQHAGPPGLGAEQDWIGHLRDALMSPALSPGRRLGALPTDRGPFAPQLGVFGGYRDFNWRPDAVLRLMSLQMQGGLGLREAAESGRFAAAWGARWGCDVVILPEVGMPRGEERYLSQAARRFGFTSFWNLGARRQRGVGMLIRDTWSPELLERGPDQRSLLVRVRFQTTARPRPLHIAGVYGVSGHGRAGGEASTRRDPEVARTNATVLRWARRAARDGAPFVVAGDPNDVEDPARDALGPRFAASEGGLVHTLLGAGLQNALRLLAPDARVFTYRGPAGLSMLDGAWTSLTAEWYPVAGAVHLNAALPFDHRPLLIDFFGGVAAPAPLRPTPSIAWRAWVGELLAAAEGDGRGEGGAGERLASLRADIAAALPVPVAAIEARLRRVPPDPRADLNAEEVREVRDALQWAHRVCVEAMRKLLPGRTGEPRPPVPPARGSAQARRDGWARVWIHLRQLRTHVRFPGTLIGGREGLRATLGETLTAYRAAWQDEKASAEEQGTPPPPDLWPRTGRALLPLSEAGLRGSGCCSDRGGPRFTTQGVVCARACTGWTPQWLSKPAGADGAPEGTSARLSPRPGSSSCDGGTPSGSSTRSSRRGRRGRATARGRFKPRRAPGRS